MRRIFLSAAAALALAAPPALTAQGTASVTGRVSDSTSGQPVAGARVGIVGTGVATLTDRDGRYLLQGLVPNTVTLRAQRIGFTPQDRVVTLVDGTVTVDFGLSAAATMLSDVVVTGYGTTNRENMSGAVATVRATDIANTPTAGVDGAMQGRAAGVQVIQNAGNPGAGITVRIRGSASITASNQPLYVIDGVPLLRDEYSQLDVGGQDITGVTGINPDEIESIDILKDAASAAIYGSRASNGVVMITTKRGRSGPARVGFSTYTGSQSVPSGSRWDLMSGPEYVEYMNEAAENDGYGPFYFGDPADPTLPNTDWQAFIFRTAPVQNINLNVTGGSDRVQYFVSGSQFRQVGVVYGSGYNRQSGRVNADITATDRLTFRTSLSLNREDHDRIENDDTIAGVVTNAIAMQPNIAATLPDGSYTTPGGDGLAYVNPRAVADFNSAESRSLRATGSLEAAYALRPAFTLHGRLGIDVLNLRDRRWYSPRVSGSYAADVFGESIIGNTTANRYMIESYVDARPTFGSSANLSFIGGASVEWNGSESDYLDGIGFASDQPQYPGNAATVVSYDGDWTGHNMVSFFSRANAVISDKYLVTASIRMDGSSRFGERHRYGLFPAASFGWKLTEESFARGLAEHADLKLRASFGVTGNHDITDNFAPLPRFSRANFVDVPGIAKESFGNVDLRWEQTNEVNVGFDLSVLDGRVTILGDWYRKTTRDLLLERPITSTSGLTSVLENVGDMQNRGYELTINAQVIRPAGAGGFRWSTDFNIAWNRNEVTKLFQGQPFPVGGYDASRVEEGHPLAAFYTLRFLGVDPATGDAIFDDVNGDLTINDADRVYIGSPHPTSWGGLTNELSWGGFDLRTFLQFTQGHTIFNAISVFANDGGYYYDNKFRKALDRWQAPGDITDEPRASFDGVSGADIISSRYFEDGSYIRLQEVTLGYRLPASVAGALRLNDGRIYISGRNLHTWTKYTGYSPDVNSDGSDSNTALATEFYAYPSARTITIGISGAF
jgi:TonB-linked SusC/RagA family outer membrane protein